MADREWDRDRDRDRDWDRDRDRQRERDRDTEWTRSSRSFEDRGPENREWQERRGSGERSWENRTEPDWRTSRHENEGGFRERSSSYYDRGPSSTRSWDRGDRERDYDDRYGRQQQQQQNWPAEQQRHWDASRSSSEWNDRDPEGRWREGSSGGRGSRPGYTGREWDRSQSQPENAYPQTLGRESYSGVGSYGGGLTTGAGRYAGRGPKNWQRSDDRIREDVNEALTRDIYVDATEIEVEVSGGEVTLNGSVEDRQMKHQAEECVWRVSGVKDVHNHVRTRQGLGGMISSVFKGDENR